MRNHRIVRRTVTTTAEEFVDPGTWCPGDTDTSADTIQVGPVCPRPSRKDDSTVPVPPARPPCPCAVDDTNDA